MINNKRDIFPPEYAPTRHCHAPAISVTPGGELLACWAGGRFDGASDSGIWSARLIEGEAGWQAPVELTGFIPVGRTNEPVWNPVLHTNSSSGELILFLKIGQSPQTWQNRALTSKDALNWTSSFWPGHLLGPTKNPPLQLENGDWIFPSSRESRAGRQICFERFDAGLESFEVIEVEASSNMKAIQPLLFKHKDGRIQALCRTQNQYIYQTWSNDSGKTWSRLQVTALPNPNSAISGTTLQDGRQLLIYNDTMIGRSKLTVAVSDDGINWHPIHVLEDQPGEFSYPAVVHAPAGNIHIVYTAQRRTIRHAELVI